MMNGLCLRVRRFLIGENIPTAIEYATMVALILGICILAGRGLGLIPG